MLGLLEISGEGRRVQTERRKLFEYDLLCVTAPRISRRYLRKAAKILAGLRVIVWDDCDTDYLRSFGINPIAPGKIYKYFTDRIFINTIKQEGLSKNTKVVIYTARVGDAEKRQIDRIIKCSRHISVKSGNMAEISEWLMENYGISQVRDMKKPDITIFMYEDNFGLCFIKNGYKYTLEKIDFHMSTELGINSGHIKSTCVALINGGVLNKDDVQIGKMSFSCEKLT